MNLSSRSLKRTTYFGKGKVAGREMVEEGRESRGRKGRGGEMRREEGRGQKRKKGGEEEEREP